jgi:TrmH family RNA methyltransferase
MIPIKNLINLPPKMRMRKIAKDLLQIENSFALDNNYPIVLQWVHDAINFFQNDDGAFSIEEQHKLENLKNELVNGGDTIRCINNFRYMLYAHIGVTSADWDFVDYDGKLAPGKRIYHQGVHIYLEDIRSPYNVGSLFRTAESFGVEKIWLSPECADPQHTRAARTAKGCTAVVPYEKALLENLAQGETIFALETGGKALSDFAFPKNGLLLVGNEELGLSSAALAIADASAGRVTIQTSGAKGSLNVSVAFGIVMQAWNASVLPSVST